MLSQTAEYALRAAVFLGEEDPAPRTARQIAEAIQVPGGYLSKVLQALCRAGVVRSQRGIGGGFRLGRPADQLTVLDIVRVVDPFRRIRTCPLDLPDHAEQLCPLHQQLDDAMATIEESFRNATIADMARKQTVKNGEARTLCPGHCREKCENGLPCSNSSNARSDAGNGVPMKQRRKRTRGKRSKGISRS